MILETFIVGPLQVNCYLIADEKTLTGIIVDPGDEPDRIIELTKDLKVNIQYILCTHGHFDHIGAVGEIKDVFGAKIILHKEDLVVYQNSYKIALTWGLSAEEQPMPDLLISEGEIIQLDGLMLNIINTPGHTPGSICAIGNGFILTGDTLFAGSIGRTDFPGGDYKKMGNSFRRLMSLDRNLKIFPGHGPFSTIGQELATNPFVYEFKA